MKMTAYDLMLKVKNELESKGFTTATTTVTATGCMYSGKAHKDGKCEYIPVKGYSFSDLFGYDIRFEVVHRHNAAEEDISVDIKIFKWYRSSGNRIARERINTKMGEKAIMNRINKIIDLYETL